MSSDNSIDISDMPDVLRLVEEANARDRPIILKRGDDELATIRPVERDVPPRKQMTGEQIEALRSAAGSWEGFDSEAFLEQLYAERELDHRPPITL